MNTRTHANRAAQAISGSKLMHDKHIMIDDRILEACERLQILHQHNKKGYSSPTLSQWIYNQMVIAINEEMAKKGLV